MTQFCGLLLALALGSANSQGLQAARPGRGNLFAAAPTSSQGTAGGVASGDDIHNAMGYGTMASGEYSCCAEYCSDKTNLCTAMGYKTTARGEYSTAMGYFTTASGEYSTAMGENTTKAKSFAETVVGRYNALGGSPSTNSWVAADAAFRVGIGTGDLNRKDALTVNEERHSRHQLG